jgi:hypothetical protein
MMSVDGLTASLPRLHLAYSRHSVSAPQQPPVSPVVPALPLLEPAPVPSLIPAPTSSPALVSAPPPELRRPINRTAAGVIPHVSYRNLSAITSSSTPSPIPRNYRSALADTSWRAAMIDEYRTLIDNGTWCFIPQPLANGSSRISTTLIVLLPVTRLSG